MAKGYEKHDVRKFLGLVQLETKQTNWDSHFKRDIDYTKIC